MKVLVTGASGQLGKALLHCAPVGTLVQAIGRADCDLANEDAVSALVTRIAPDIVINAAAHTAVDRAESEPDLARAVNAEAVAAIVGGLAATGGKLVQISTDFVFDGRSPRAYLPDDHRHPLSVYGCTKAAGEDAVRPDDLIIRTSWLYAAGGANFVRTMLRLMREREEVRVVADQIGAPTWATGFARTIWGLIAAGASGTFHHCDAGVASWYDFAVATQEEARQLGLLARAAPIIPIATADFPTPAARPAFSLLDCSTTRAALGDGQAHWRENLRLMLKEERALAG